MPVIDLDKAPVVQSEFHKSKTLVSPDVLNSRDVTVRLNEIAVGFAHESHTHTTDEMLIILEGTGEYTESDAKSTIGPMSVVYIPRGTVHSVRVIGKTPMRLFVIKAPPE
jgi:quercetin dioxygenase-like cupin family protein